MFFLGIATIVLCTMVMTNSDANENNKSLIYDNIINAV